MLRVRVKLLFFYYYQFFFSLRYYVKSGRLLLADVTLFLLYLFRSPYQMLKKLADLNPYGETPYPVLDRIARRCQILSKDHFFDLGCGRGKTVLWMESHVGCQATGIDREPLFIRRATQMAKWFGFRKVQFVNEDILKASLDRATVIYVCGSGFPDELVEQLVVKLEKIKEGTRVITVGFELSDYSSRFITKETFTGRFAWGKCDIFLNTLTQSICFLKFSKSLL